MTLWRHGWEEQSVRISEDFFVMGCLRWPKRVLAPTGALCHSRDDAYACAAISSRWAPVPTVSFALFTGRLLVPTHSCEFLPFSLDPLTARPHRTEYISIPPPCFGLSGRLSFIPSASRQAPCLFMLCRRKAGHLSRCECCVSIFQCLCFPVLVSGGKRWQWAMVRT